jgi:hypothetical protein
LSRRREINGVIAGLLGSFVSRNNDVGGYWAIGKLYTHARAKNVDLIAIDLMTSRMSPGLPEFESMVNKFATSLVERLSRRRIPREAVISAQLAVAFDSAVLFSKAPPQFMIGKPHRCNLELVDDLGRVNAATHLGSVRPHSAVRETRSGRA